MILVYIMAIMHESLKTRDKLQQWDVTGNVDILSLVCPLCSLTRDSHSHLFFECIYASRLWDRVRVLACMEDVDSVWSNIVAYLQPLASRNIF